MTEENPPLILHVLHHLVIGGMENGLVNLVNHLPAKRYRHAVVCIEDFSEFRNRIHSPEVEVFALHRSKVGVQAVRREIYRLCRQLKPTLIHTRALSGLDALLPARLAGVRYSVHSEHGWNVDNLTGSAWKPAFLRRLHRPLVDRYITVSKDLERFLCQRIGVSARNISQIYNGVDTTRFSPTASKHKVEGVPNGFIDTNVVCFGTVGRAQAVKDQATLIRAFAHVLDIRADLRARMRLILIGDGPLLPALRELASELQLDDVAWLPGSSSKVDEHLQNFDVFVLPSLNEGISNTILEAMACGLPVLATGVGGNVELVQDGITGKIFDPGNVSQLAMLIQAYVDHPGSRIEQGRAARQTALERFSLDAMVASYASVYDSLCRI